MRSGLPFEGGGCRAAFGLSRRNRPEFGNNRPSHYRAMISDRFSTYLSVSADTNQQDELELLRPQGGVASARFRRLHAFTRIRKSTNLDSWSWHRRVVQRRYRRLCHTARLGRRSGDQSRSRRFDKARGFPKSLPNRRVMAGIVGSHTSEVEARITPQVPLDSLRSFYNNVPGCSRAERFERGSKIAGWRARLLGVKGQLRMTDQPNR